MCLLAVEAIFNLLQAAGSFFLFVLPIFPDLCGSLKLDLIRDVLKVATPRVTTYLAAGLSY